MCILVRDVRQTLVHCRFEINTPCHSLRNDSFLILLCIVAVYNAYMTTNRGGDLGGGIGPTTLWPWEGSAGVVTYGGHEEVELADTAHQHEDRNNIPGLSS